MMNIAPIRIRTPLLMFSLLFTMWSCGEDSDSQRFPGEDFAVAGAVRVTSPANGDTLESPFTVQFTTAEGVDSVRLEAGGATINTADAATAEMIVELDEGRVGLRLIGMDENGDDLSDHSIGVKVVAAEEPWVTITSPADGAEVTNPVTFALTASEDIDLITIEADGWELGSVNPDDTLTYTFTNTDEIRDILATGWTTEEEPVASDEIEITVIEGAIPSDSDFNNTLMDYLESYPTDGTHGYYWPSDGNWAGTTQDIWYLETLVAEGDDQGRCYCVGLTWELYMRTFADVDVATGGDGSLNGIGLDDLAEFQMDWYVRDLWGTGIVEALENYGLGEEVTDLNDVQMGDVVQFWRYSGSGHNVVFIDWERDADDQIIGIYYWATQNSTDGIGYNSEYFGSSGSYIDPNFFFVGRAHMPENWIPWE